MAEIQTYVVEEVRNTLMPFFIKKRISKEEYKDVLRKAVPKVELILLVTFCIFFGLAMDAAAAMSFHLSLSPDPQVELGFVVW